MAYSDSNAVAHEYDLVKGIIDREVEARNLEALKMHGKCLAADNTEMARHMPNVRVMMLEYCRAAYEFVSRNGEGYTLAPAPLLIEDGTYTLVYLDGGYKTFRIRSVKTGKLAGKRIAEYLSGPDNSLDFQAFAMVNESSINVWRRFEGGKLVNFAREIEKVARGGDLDAAGIAYAETSGRCRRCNKVLTVPASLAAGYGPDCAGKVGIAYGADRRSVGTGEPVAVEARGDLRVEHMTQPPFTVNPYANVSDEDLDHMIDQAERADARAQDAFENPTGDAAAVRAADAMQAELNRRAAARMAAAAERVEVPVNPFVTQATKQYPSYA